MSVHEDPITAHGGGELVDLKAPASEQAALRSHAATLPVVTLNARDLADLDDDAHPVAKNVTSMPPFCLAGPLKLIAEIPGRTFLEYPREPRQTRADFRKRGWRKIVAFQTRNPTHRAHEYIQKAALETCD